MSTAELKMATNERSPPLGTGCIQADAGSAAVLHINALQINANSAVSWAASRFREETLPFTGSTLSTFPSLQAISKKRSEEGPVSMEGHGPKAVSWLNEAGIKSHFLKAQSALQVK